MNKKQSLGLKVGIVGATGVVGKELIKILEQRKFPVESLRLFASENSKGLMETFQGDPIDVEVLEYGCYKGLDVLFFSAGGEISSQYVPLAAKEGIFCIDNTSHFRMQDDVPLIVPEVNAACLTASNKIIANPNCSTAQVVVALAPLHKTYRIKRIVYSTYQSVSGAGKSALDDLEHETRHNLSGRDFKPKNFTCPIAFNVVPQIDVFLDSGYTKEEVKMIDETKKIIGDNSIQVTATAVRVPVFVGHAVAMNVEFHQDFCLKTVRECLETAKGLTLMDDPKENLYPTPRQVAGEDDVYVGRLRRDLSNPSALEMWCVADNLRKGAALNAIQIAEALVEKGFLKAKS